MIQALLLFYLALLPNFGLALPDDRSADARIPKILASMTLEEKIAQTFAGHGPRERLLPTVRSVGIGSAKFSPLLGWSNHKVVDMVRARNDLQRQALNATKGRIPVAFFDEGDHGAVAGGTIFPMPVGQGCSWNASLVKEIAAVLAVEASAVGIDTLFAPVVNMVVDPRFGRLQENFSENPILTKVLAVASVLGLQNSTSRVAALGKHLAAYGDSSGGLNGGSSSATERLLYDVYLRPWHAMAKAGLKALMPAHNTVLHVPCHASKWLLNDTLRNSFAFDGVMLSDCNDVGVLQDFRMAANLSHAAALALKAGVDWDLQCDKDPDRWAYNHLKEALEHGLITEADIDRSVARILKHKMELGLFDERQFTDETAAEEVLDNPKHRKLALEAAEQSTVLLINRNEALPLDFSSIHSIALLGPTASRSGCKCAEATSSLMGDYSFGGAHVVTLDEALQTSFPNISVNWAMGCTASGPTRPSTNSSDIAEAVALATQSDVTILVLGDVQGGCGEWRDRDSLDLQGTQLALLEAVAPVAKKTIVVLVHGRPQTFGTGNRVLSEVDALFAAWRPGEEFGTAMIRLLGGEVNPSAKLSTSWPRSVGHVGSGSVPWLQEIKGKWVANKRGSADPDGRRYNNYASSSSADATPLFYFGHGLSYTTFEYKSLDVLKSSDADTLWLLNVTLSNTGERDGVEIIQAYVQDPILPYVAFWKRLVGFTRCMVPRESTTSCIISVAKDDVAAYDPVEKMKIHQGVYNVRVGGSSKSDSMVQDIMVAEDDACYDYDHSRNQAKEGVQTAVAR